MESYSCAVMGHVDTGKSFTTSQLILKYCVEEDLKVMIEKMRNI